MGYIIPAILSCYFVLSPKKKSFFCFVLSPLHPCYLLWLCFILDPWPLSPPWLTARCWVWLRRRLWPPTWSHRRATEVEVEQAGWRTAVGVRPRALWCGTPPGTQQGTRYWTCDFVREKCVIFSRVFYSVMILCVFQAPDMSSAEDFPTFGTGVTLKQASAWGPKKF